jgi:hypothetical protein
MRTNRLLLSAILAIATATISTLSAGVALAASTSEIDRNATQALSMLYATTGLPPWIIPELKLELGPSQPRDPGGA